MLAAQPVVAISGAGEATLGGTTTLTLTFDNQPDGSPGSTVGYAPYIDLILPRNGADGAGVGSEPPFENDGVSFVSASYLGRPVTATVLEFDAEGEAVHPFARDQAGELRVVRAADYGLGPGDEVAVLLLPFGSFTPDQTPQQITVSLATSPLADVGVALPVSAVGGFAFGRDALNNPTVDPPLLGPVVAATITPTLLSLTKSFSGPDGETATGPNFPRAYTLSLDIAAGQTLADLVFTDRLPDGIVVTNAAITAGPAGTVALDPLTNDLTIRFTEPLIGAAGADVTVRVDFHVGEFLGPGAPATPVLDPATGAARPLANDLAATATWTPLDPRDPTTTVTVDPSGPENVFTARSLAVQKTVAVVGGGAPEPFDTLRWTLSAQLSDYFSAAGLVLSDTLSDGQRADPASPVLTVREGGAVLYAGAFDAANVTIVENADGTTAIAFRVADELALRGLDPTLSGGRVGDPAGATTLTVTFESEVSRFYADGRPLLQGDGLGNTVGIAGTLPGSGNTVADAGAAGGALARGGGLAKSVYLVNGEAPALALPPITNGDTVTFRLQYTLPTGSANTFTLTDFLPLPVFRVIGEGGPLTFLDIRDDGTNPGTIPPPGSAWWHPDETFDLAAPTGYAGTPTLILDAASNSLTFDFGSFHMPVPQPLKVDVLFRLPVEDRPFGDNLFLTNLVTSREANTAGTVASSNAIAQLLLTQPALNLTKGVIGIETGQTTFPVTLDPAVAGPVPFAPPGSTGTPFAGAITSAALAATPIDSDLSGADAGDLVRFALVVENTGSGIRGAHDILIGDTLPDGFVIPAGGLNLTVTRGDGVAIPFVLRGDGLFDPAGGIELLDQADLDPASLQGALTRLSPATAATGSNLALIVYDLRIADTAEATGLAMTNTGEIAFYAAVGGGSDFAVNLLPEDRFDDATVITGDPILDKVLVSTSIAESNDPFVLIGEEVLFRITLSLREGLTRDLVLADLLPTTPGTLTLRDWTLVGLGSNIAFTGFAPPVGAPQVGPITLALGDATNAADNVFDARDQVVFEVRAVVGNLPQNNRGDVLVNTASATFTDATGATRSILDTESVTITEPGPEITKTANRTTADGGDVVGYTLRVTNPVIGGVTAPVFDLNVRDIFNDPDLSLVAGTVVLGGTAAGRAAVLLGNGAGDQSIRIFIAALNPGETLTIAYQGRISDTVESGRAVLNTAIAQGDSAPGDVPGQRSYEDLDTETVRITGPALSKIVFSTSLPDTGSSQGNAGRTDLAFGEEVTFRLTARFAEGTTVDASLIDLLPLGLTLEARSASIVSVGANLTAPGAIAGAQAVLSDRNGNGFNDRAAFALGTVVNRPDGVSNAADTIVFDVTARLRGDLGAAAGVVLTNTGNLAFRAEGADRVVSAQAAVETVLPRLAIEKVADRLTADGGDVLTYTVRLRDLSGGFAAPAYDIVLTDLLEDDDLTLVTGSVALSGIPATIIEGNAPGDTAIRVAIDRILIGQTLTLTYQARVTDAVIAGSTADNIVRFTGDTHPGVRPGEVTLAGADTETVRIGVPALEKVVFATSLPETGAGQFAPGRPDVAIGETVVFRLTVTIPEATNILLSLVDQMPTAPGVMEYLAYEILPLPDATNLDFVPGTEIAAISDTNGDGRADRLKLDFGTVTNAPDNVTDANDQIVVLVSGRVVDVPGNIAGRTLVNTAQTFLDAAPQAPATAALDVVEPLLVIDKSSSRLTGDAGDRTTYTIVVAPAPTMTGPAYGVRLTDLLPEGVTLIAGSVATSAGAVVTGNAAGDATIVVALPTILPGAAAITITFAARLDNSVEPEQRIDNRADLAYASAPSFERDYSAFDTARIVVAMPPLVSKQVVVTSLPETSFQFFDGLAPDVAIGETITYRIITTLAEGTQTLVLRDLLPGAGAAALGSLRVLDARVDAIGANISGAALAVGDAGTVADNVVTFAFGTLVNAGDNVTDGRDQIAVVVRARVTDIAENAAGVQLRNEGEAIVGAPSDPSVRIVRTDAAVVDVVEPRLAIFKDASTPTGDAGDEIVWRLTVVNVPGATAPAYELVVTDLLPPGMTLIAGSVTADRGSILAGNAPGDTTIRVALGNDPLLPLTSPATPIDDTRVIIGYRARLDDTVEPGAVLVNEARFTALSAPPSLAGDDVRSFTATTSAAVTVLMPVTLTKTILATSPALGSGAFDPANPDLAIGGTVTYRLTAELSEGTQRLVITDTLPDGLVFVDGRVVSVGAGLPAGLAGTTPSVGGQVVRFDFGVVANAGNNDPGDGTVVVEVIARVADVASNQAGTVLANAGTATVSSPTDPARPGGTETATDSTSADVVAPALVLEKSEPGGFARPGDVITYTLSLRHAAGSTAPAYDLVIADALADAALALVPGTVATTAGRIVTGNAAGDATVAIALDVLAVGETVTVTFSAVVAAVAPPGGTVLNTATAAFDTSPGDGGRPGSVADDAAVPLAPGFAKTIVATSIGETPGNAVTVGERITYELTATLPRGTIADLVIADLLPAGLVPLSATVVSVGAGLAGAALAPGAAGTIGGQAVTFGFGTVVNGSGTAIGAEDQVTVRIIAEVADLPAVSEGAVLPNAARLGYVIGGEAGGESDAVPVLVVEPALAIAKTVDRLTGDAGDLFTYTVTVTPFGTGPAFDVVVTDVLDAVLLPVSASASAGTAAIAGQTITLSLPVLLPGDAPVVLTYTVRLADAVEPGQVVGNTAALAFDSAPGDGGRPGAGEASAPDLTAVFDLSLAKRIVATSLPETGTGFFDPDRDDIAIGEVITYEVVATLAEGTQRVVLRDLLPGGLAFVPGSFSIAAGSAISAGPGGTLAPVPVLAGQAATADFGVLVNAGDNLRDEGDTIVLRFEAIARDDTVNVAGRVFANAAEATASAPTSPGAPGGTLTAGDSVAAEIVTPSLAITKAAAPGRGDAGDVFTYTLRVANAPDSTGPAYGVVVLDTLPGPLVYVPGSIATTLGTAAVTGNAIRVEIPVLLPTDAAVTITFQARLGDAVEPGQIVTNTATVTYGTSPGPISRPGSDGDSATVIGSLPLALAKSIIATSLPETGSGAFDPDRPDLAIGEVVTYRIVATLGEGTQRVVITDTLPQGLVPETAVITAAGGILPPGLVGRPGEIAGQSVRFDLGTIVNSGNNTGDDDTIVIAVTARVADVPANQSGTLLVNDAAVSATAPTAPGNPGGTLTADAAAGADVVVPLLVIDKSADRLFAVIGEAVTYTIVLAHAPGSTAPAFAVSLADALAGTALRLVAGSVTTSFGTIASGNGGGDAAVLVTADVLPLGQSIVVTFQAVPVTVPLPGGQAPNTAAFAAASAPDGPPGFVRPFSGSDTVVLLVNGGFLGGAPFGTLDALDRFLAEALGVAAPTPAPIYSGTATPGAAVSLVVRDATGAIAGQETRFADLGGNWLVSMPGMERTPGPAENTETLRATMPVAGGPIRNVNADLPGVTREAPPPSAATAGAALSLTPQQGLATLLAGSGGADNTRLYFAGVTGPATFAASPVDPLSEGSAGGLAAIAAGAPGIARPFGLALNKFAIEFLAGSTVPSGRLN